MSKRFSHVLLSGLLLAPLLAQAYPFAYLPHYSSNTVQVVDVAGNVFKNTLAVTAPIAVEVLPNGTGVVVASEANALLIYTTKYPDPARDQTGQPLTVALPGKPVGLAVSPDSKHIWVSIEGSARLLRLDAAAPADVARRGEVELGFQPGALTASHLLREVVASGNNYSYHIFAAARTGTEAVRLTVLNDALPSTPTKTWTLSQPAASRLAVSISPFLLFASHPATGRVSVLSADDGTASTPLIANSAGALAVNRGNLYVATPGEVKRWTLGSTLGAAAGITVSGQPQRLSTSIDGGTLYVHDAAGSWTTADTQQGQSGLVNAPTFGQFVGPYPSILGLDSVNGSYVLNESADASKIVRVSRLGDLTSTPSFRVVASDRGIDTSTDARKGQDYEPLDTVLTFKEGERDVAVPLRLIDDGYYGNTEYFHLYLTDVTAPALNANQAAPVTISIVSDDSDPREDRAGCSTAGRGGRFDPSLPLLGLAAAGVLLQRLRRRG